MIHGSPGRQNHSYFLVQSICTSPVLFLLLTGTTAAVSGDRSPGEADQYLANSDEDVLTITITPQWRPSDPDRLPIAIDVLDAGELDDSGISNTLDLQNRVPGFSFKTNTVLGQPYLRGVGSDIISAGSDASVATFIDGVYMTRATRSILDFHDIEHVDVMKGPQGVQLGRNVAGGAISIVSRDPVPYFESYADATYGSFNRRQARGMLNMPLGDSDFSLRFSALVNKRDGYFKNIFLDRELDDEDTRAFRSKLRYHPSADTDVVLSIETTTEDDTRASGHQPDPVQGVNGGILNGGTVPDDPWKVNHNLAASGFVDTDLSSLRINRYFDETELHSITAYQYSDLGLVLDLDGTEVDFSTNRPVESSTTYSQEVRLLSRQEYPYSWLLGVYYMHEDADQSVDVRFPMANIRNLAVANVRTDASAVFGKISRYFGKHWRGTAGARYSHDRRSLDMVQTIDDPNGVFGPPGTTTLLQRETESWGALTPEAILEYLPDRNSLAYAKISSGYKSGGFNTTAVQPAFDPEDLRAYEVGFKASRPEDSVRFHSAAFYYDYRDIQLLTPPANAPVGTFPIVINAAEATVKGVDLSGSMRPIDDLELSLGITLLDAKFDKFVSIDPNNPADDPDRAGDPTPQAPDISLNLGTVYRWLTDNCEFMARLYYRYQSAVYFNPYKDSAVRQDGYGLLDASISFEGGKGHWYGELFGKNLTDELYARSKIRVDPTVGVMRFWGDPRTFGIRVGFRL